MYQVQKQTLNGWIVTHVFDDVVMAENMYHQSRLKFDGCKWRLVSLTVMQES